MAEERSEMDVLMEMESENLEILSRIDSAIERLQRKYEAYIKTDDEESVIPDGTTTGMGSECLDALRRKNETIERLEKEMESMRERHAREISLVMSSLESVREAYSRCVISGYSAGDSDEI